MHCIRQFLFDFFVVDCCCGGCKHLRINCNFLEIGSKSELCQVFFMEKDFPYNCRWFSNFLFCRDSKLTLCMGAFVTYQWITTGNFNSKIKVIQIVGQVFLHWNSINFIFQTLFVCKINISPRIPIYSDFFSHCSQTLSQKINWWKC